MNIRTAALAAALGGATFGTASAEDRFDNYFAAQVSAQSVAVVYIAYRHVRLCDGIPFIEEKSKDLKKYLKDLDNTLRSYNFDPESIWAESLSIEFPPGNLKNNLDIIDQKAGTYSRLFTVDQLRVSIGCKEAYDFVQSEAGWLKSNISVHTEAFREDLRKKDF